LTEANEEPVRLTVRMEISGTVGLEMQVMRRRMAPTKRRKEPIK